MATTSGDSIKPSPGKDDHHKFSSEGGHFRRQVQSFRATITPISSQDLNLKKDNEEAVNNNGDNREFEWEEGRYFLIANYGCPWANRTLITRKLKKLEKSIDLNLIGPELTKDRGWLYDPKSGSDAGDPVWGLDNLKDVYMKVDPEYKLRYTVPVLFDRKKKTIVNNESSEIIRIFNTLNTSPDVPDLYPPELRKEIDEINEWVYHKINNGVYKCGFATTQKAYDANIYPLFEALDRVESILSSPSDREYLVGPGKGQLTEADVRLYTTVARFDIAYYSFFRCNIRMIKDYPNISAWFKRLYAIPEFESVTKFDVIKKGYGKFGERKMDEELIIPAGPAEIF